MKILVTGGAGFIGSHVADRLEAAGHEVRIFDLRESPHHEPGHFDTFIGDLLDAGDVRRAMEGCDAVAHLAAAADVNEVEAEPADAEALNSRGTVNVLEAARELDVKRVVYASTIWVYSDVEAETADEDTALALPSHLYTATKLAGEMYCRSYGELYDLEWTILRFGIPYGPRARPAAVVPVFVNKAICGEPLTIAGGGKQTRRFVYVEDLAEGVARSFDDVAANRIYNLVSDVDVSIREVAETVIETVGNAELVDTPGRSADFKGVEVCGKRAEAELGWTAATRFDEGVRRYVAWHRDDEAKREEAEAETALVPAAAETRKQLSRRSRLGAVLGTLADRAGVVAVIPCAVLLIPLLLALDRAGAGRDDLETVGIMSLVGIILYSALMPDGSRTRGSTATRWAWVGVGLFVAALVQWQNGPLHLDNPRITALILSVVGGLFGAITAAAVRWLLRGGVRERAPDWRG